MLNHAKTHEPQEPSKRKIYQNSWLSELWDNIEKIKYQVVYQTKPLFDTHFEEKFDLE